MRPPYALAVANDKKARITAPAAYTDGKYLYLCNFGGKNLLRTADPLSGHWDLAGVLENGAGDPDLFLDDDGKLYMVSGLGETSIWEVNHDRLQDGEGNARHAGALLQDARRFRRLEFSLRSFLRPPRLQPRELEPARRAGHLEAGPERARQRHPDRGRQLADEVPGPLLSLRRQSRHLLPLVQRLGLGVRFDPWKISVWPIMRPAR